MKMYLHLFTTAGVCLTASVINFDLAELFCWSSRVWSVPSPSWYSEHACLLYTHRSPNPGSGESYYKNGWNLLKILNGLWEWGEKNRWRRRRNRRVSKEREREREMGGWVVREWTSMLKFHTLPNLWLKNYNSNTNLPQAEQEFDKVNFEKMNPLPTLSGAPCGLAWTAHWESVLSHPC